MVAATIEAPTVVLLAGGAARAARPIGAAGGAPLHAP
jgi:hypothetical protein